MLEKMGKLSRKFCEVSIRGPDGWTRGLSDGRLSQWDFAFRAILGKDFGRNLGFNPLTTYPRTRAPLDLNFGEFARPITYFAKESVVSIVTAVNLSQ